MTCMIVSYCVLCTCTFNVHAYAFKQCTHTFAQNPQHLSLPLEVILRAYKGSQIYLPPPDKQWYKRNDGGSGEGDNGTDGEAGADDDQSLKTQSPLPPSLPSLPRADPHWYKSRDESKGSEAMEICSIEGGTEKDLNLYSDKDEDRDPDVSSSEEGLNESGKCNIHACTSSHTTCKYTHIHTNTCTLYVHDMHTTCKLIE